MTTPLNTQSGKGFEDCPLVLLVMQLRTGKKARQALSMHAFLKELKSVVICAKMGSRARVEKGKVRT